MENAEILKKAIEKVVKNGFKSPYKWLSEDDIMVALRGAFNDNLIGNKYYELIFSHDFAKAFWGKWEMVADDESGIPILIPFEVASQRGSGKYIWQHYLQQMVLEPEPLKYLEKFL